MFRFRNNGAYFLLGFALSLVGCSTTPPIAEYTLARTAVNYALESEAARFAPGFWHEAEEAFRRGEYNFQKKDFAEAKEEFLLAKTFAERAENFAKLQKFKSGESP